MSLSVSRPQGKFMYAPEPAGLNFLARAGELLTFIDWVEIFNEKLNN